MTSENARKLVESEGFTVFDYIGEEKGIHFFVCGGEQGTTVEVCVVDGEVIVAPT